MGSKEAEKVQDYLNQVMFTRFLQQSPEAQQLWQQLQSADEETGQEILARLQQNKLYTCRYCLQYSRLSLGH